MKLKFTRKKSAIGVALTAVGLSVLATLNYAQSTPQSVVSREVEASIRAGHSIQTIIAAEIKAGRDPAAVMSTLGIAMSQGRLPRTPEVVFAEFAKAAPNQIAQLAAAAIEHFGRSETSNKSEYAQASPTALMNAIVAATPSGQLGAVMSAVMGAANSISTGNRPDSLPGVVYAATQAIANDPRSGSSTEFSPGAAVVSAVGTLNNRAPDVAIRVAQAAVLALPGNTQSVILSLSKLEATEQGMSSQAMSALKAAVTQTIVSNPSQATTIAGYATQTIVANVPSRHYGDMAPLANIVMQGVLDGIVQSPSLSNAAPHQTGALIAVAISSAASYASAPNLVASMLSNTAAYFSGAATEANSAAFSGMVQQAAQRLAVDFPNQAVAISAVQTTVSPQPLNANAVTAGTPSLPAPAAAQIETGTPPSNDIASNTTPPSGTVTPNTANFSLTGLGSESADPTAGLPAPGAGIATPPQAPLGQGDAPTVSAGLSGSSFGVSPSSSFSGGGGGGISPN